MNDKLSTRALTLKIWKI